MSSDDDGPTVEPGIDGFEGRDGERKMRLHEYRVAANREKRLRKADEKKQRKLNATILRRMTRNPDRYNKNAERNRLRDIQDERRKIRSAALRQVRHLAALYDPSGTMFNIGPVGRPSVGLASSAETSRRWEEDGVAKAPYSNATMNAHTNGATDTRLSSAEECGHDSAIYRMDQDCVARPWDSKDKQIGRTSRKPQQLNYAVTRNLSSPPKPRIPEGISIPDGEPNWLALWDISDDQIEKNIMLSKIAKAAERKALRAKQQEGKYERREARDVKRKAYRDIKAIWRSIKEDHTKERARLNAAEEEESKKIAVEINEAERKVALNICQFLGFTIDNTPGTKDIKPRVLGMRGKEIDFEAIEAEHRQRHRKASGGGRVDLCIVARSATETLIPTDRELDLTHGQDFIKLDAAEGQGQGQGATLSNRKLRQKVHRAFDHAQARKEKIVRQRAIAYLKGKGEEVPDELKTSCRVQNIKGVRILENGAKETPKQEKIYRTHELKTFNEASRVLRKQAKHHAIESGLRKHAEVTGIMPNNGQLTEAGLLRMPSHISATAVGLEMTAKEN
ncbi:MAG: hypothetical protein Q9218_001139 [Villophora microphyllina]